MRHEVIKLTDVAIYPELIKLIESKGEPIFTKSRKGGEGAFLFFDGDEWIRGDEDDIEGEYTPLIDLEFLQKYGENTAPEADKERELLEKFCSKLGIDGKGVLITDFLTSIRKPAFELVTADNVKITNQYQSVFLIEKDGIDEYEAGQCVRKNYAGPYFSSKQAANSYRLNNTPAIKLSDMTLEGDYYWIWEKDAHNLVNERINGK